MNQARKLNPDLPIIVRAHSFAQEEHVMKYGASRIVMGEQEIARAMFAAVPDAPREPVLSSVEEADDMTVQDGSTDTGAVHAVADERLPDVLGPEADADQAGGNPAEERPTREHAHEPGR